MQNQVEGIGRARIAAHAGYGSGGALLGVELYYNASLLDNKVSNHELTHTWSHAFDWSRIAGIVRAGHQPVSHAPLMTGGESLVSAVLEPTRRALVRADGSAVIERVNAPARHHPLDLYAMGLLAPADVPEWMVFEDQAQFSATTSGTPDVGAAVAGAGGACPSTTSWPRTGRVAGRCYPISTLQPVAAGRVTDGALRPRGSADLARPEPE